MFLVAIHSSSVGIGSFETVISYYTCNNTQIVQLHGGVTVVNIGVAAAPATRLATQQMDAQWGVRRAL